MTNPEFLEPVGNEKGGWWKEEEGRARAYARRITTAWETFLEEEGIPVYEGIGVKDSRELPRADWPRLGGKGTYIQLFGTANTHGMFVVEVPPRGALHPQRHMYEERYMVLEGRGSTEVWKNGETAVSAFEWQPWSLFAIPLNANFRIINSSSSPALLLAMNTAPRIINVFQNNNFVFNCDFNFDDRFGGNLEDYWKANDELEHHPAYGRAMVESNLIPDVVSSYLPLDQNRGPGHRWVTPYQAKNTTLQGWIAEYPSGRYAKAHAHGAGAVLLCITGKGYSITWPSKEGGVTPWEDGKGHLVRMQEYGPGGLVSAAPGPSDWYHQHFAYGKDPWRIMRATGGIMGNPGFEGGARDLSKAGDLIPIHRELGDREGGFASNTIPYHMEDPHVRRYFEQKLQEEGAQMTMPPEVYTASGAKIQVMED
jgi:mannose-6-phosphate isomerase-like protein (cupin superfamily)